MNKCVFANVLPSIIDQRTVRNIRDAMNVIELQTCVAFKDVRSLSATVRKERHFVVFSSDGNRYVNLRKCVLLYLYMYIIVLYEPLFNYFRFIQFVMVTNSTSKYDLVYQS